MNFHFTDLFSPGHKRPWQTMVRASGVPRHLPGPFEAGRRQVACSFKCVCLSDKDMLVSATTPQTRDLIIHQIITELCPIIAPGEERIVSLRSRRRNDSSSRFVSIEKVEEEIMQNQGVPGPDSVPVWAPKGPDAPDHN